MWRVDNIHPTASATDPQIHRESSRRAIPRRLVHALCSVCCSTHQPSVHARCAVHRQRRPCTHAQRATPGADIHAADVSLLSLTADMAGMADITSRHKACASTLVPSEIRRGEPRPPVGACPRGWQLSAIEGSRRASSHRVSIAASSRRPFGFGGGASGGEYVVCGPDKRPSHASQPGRRASVFTAGSCGHRLTQN